MVSDIRVVLTEDGWHKLKQELAELLELRAARVAEYAQEKQEGHTDEAPRYYYQSDIAAIDQRLSALKETLGRAMIASAVDLAPGTVGVSSRVAVLWDDGRQARFTIVGPPEVDLHLGRISYESPVGKALLGKREGDLAEVHTPDGIRRLEILEVDSGHPG